MSIVIHILSITTVGYHRESEKKEEQFFWIFLFLKKFKLIYKSENTLFRLKFARYTEYSFGIGEGIA